MTNKINLSSDSEPPRGSSSPSSYSSHTRFLWIFFSCDPLGLWSVLEWQTMRPRAEQWAGPQWALSPQHRCILAQGFLGVGPKDDGGRQPFVTWFCCRLGFYFMNLLLHSQWAESFSPWLSLIPPLCAWQKGIRQRKKPEWSRRRVTHAARRLTCTTSKVSVALFPTLLPGTMLLSFMLATPTDQNQDRGSKKNPSSFTVTFNRYSPRYPKPCWELIRVWLILDLTQMQISIFIT